MPAPGVVLPRLAAHVRQLSDKTCQRREGCPARSGAGGKPIPLVLLQTTSSSYGLAKRRNSETQLEEWRAWVSGHAGEAICADLIEWGEWEKGPEMVPGDRIGAVVYSSLRLS